MPRIKSTEQFTGLTLEQWLGDVDNITWAQQEPRFKMMLSVLLNESRVTYLGASGCSEGRAFGRVEGYNQAIEVLRSLGRAPVKLKKELEATFDEPLEQSLKQQDVYD